MRKFVLISIALVYTLLSLGVNLQLHYCCGKLADVQLVGAKSDCCESAESEDHGCTLNHKCCTNEDVKILIEDEHQPSQFKVVFNSFAAISLPHIVAEFPISAISKQKISFGANSDPPDQLPIYLMQQSLLLYA